MRRLFVLLIMGCIYIVAYGQEENLRARLFDSYGRIGYEDLSARLDSFAIELENRRDATGYLISWGPEGEEHGTGTFAVKITKHYLVDSRGIDAGRIQTIYAGRYENPSENFNELWLVPTGADPPEPRHYEQKPKPVSGKFEERRAWDDLPQGIEEEGGRPSLGNVAHAAFADALREEPNTTLYIVAFSLCGSAPGTWSRIAKNEAADLEERGIKADRVKIIYGGVKEESSEETSKGSSDQAPQMAILQLWALPIDAPPPVKDAGPEQPPNEAAKMGSYNDYWLKDPDTERRIFDAFKDVLLADKQLNACIIVWLRSACEECADAPQESKESEESKESKEPDAIDPSELVSKWKSELMEKYGIDESRIVVMPARANETKDATLDVWIVPPGAALPNPYNTPMEPTIDPESPGQF
jgi:hypothetical protein